MFPIYYEQFVHGGRAIAIRYCQKPGRLIVFMTKSLLFKFFVRRRTFVKHKFFFQKCINDIILPWKVWTTRDKYFITKTSDYTRRPTAGMLCYQAL